MSTSFPNLQIDVVPPSVELFDEIIHEGLYWKGGALLELSAKFKHGDPLENLIFSTARGPNGQLIAWAFADSEPFRMFDIVRMITNRKFWDFTKVSIGVWVEESFRGRGVVEQLLRPLVDLHSEQSFYSAYHLSICAVLDRLNVVYVCYLDNGEIVDRYGVVNREGLEKLRIRNAAAQGETVGQIDYSEFKERALSPRREVLIPSLYYRQECDPKEDPEWPTPTNRNEAEALLGRLPDRSQVICALTAAELVLPIWADQWEPGSPNIDLRPREAIETTWRWLNGEATIEEVVAAEDAAWSAAWSAAWGAARVAAEAAAMAARSAAWAARSSVAAVAAWAATAVAGAAVAAAWAAATAAARAGWMPEEEFYDLWWKECRCRLAIDQPEAQELTTKGVEGYEGLKRYLKSPERETHIPSLFMRRKCDPKEDPEWPTPKTREETEALLERLPHRAQVICALIAAELVLPIWESQWPPENSDIDTTAREAIEATWQWLHGTLNEEELRTAEHATTDALIAASPRGFLNRAGWAIADASWSAISSMPEHIAPRSVYGAAQAFSLAGWLSVEEFYDLWWRECRCALAIDKPGETELTTKGPPQTAGGMRSRIENYLTQDRRKSIIEHFQHLGYPVNAFDPLDGVLGCGGNGCVFRAGPALALKISTNYRYELPTLRALSSAELIGHPGLAIITPADQIYEDQENDIYAYLVWEVAPLTSSLVRDDITFLEQESISLKLHRLLLAEQNILNGLLLNNQSPIVAGLKDIYTLGQDPFFGPVADLVLQGALDGYIISGDLSRQNVGFYVDEKGKVLYEKGLVAYDIHGIKVGHAPNIGLYADYVLDMESGTFI